MMNNDDNCLGFGFSCACDCGFRDHLSRNELIWVGAISVARIFRQLGSVCYKRVNFALIGVNNHILSLLTSFLSFDNQAGLGTEELRGSFDAAN